MTIVDMLRKNAELYPNEVALVEVNPQRHESTSWSRPQTTSPSGAR